MKKFLITIIAVFLLIPFAVKAESVQTGKFRYMPAFEEETQEVYYYSDDYFSKSGKEYNEHLLSMSYNLALSTFEVRGAKYCSSLLTDTGFQDIEVFDMNEKPTLDSLGMLIGHKKVGNRQLLVIALRGEKYDSEWGNNFIVGKNGDAKGFCDSSQKAIERVRKYIDDHRLKDLKIWAVGYSRAGAIADLLGVYFNQHLSEFDTSADDLYIYTFETPAASKEDVVYDNIYVVRNINDLIPFVYPEGWGLNTNGKIIEIGENQTIMTYTGLIEQEEYEEKQLNEFYHDFFDWLSGRISRETYSQYLEGPLSSLLDIYFSKSAEDREALLNFFMEDVKSQLLDNEDNKNKLISKAWAVMGHNSDFLYQSISNDIISIMDGIRDSENGSTITDEEYETIRSSVYPLLRALGPLVIDDSNYYAGIDYEHYYTYDAEDYNLTDEQMGEKHGKVNGFFNGYDDAVNSYAYDETPDEDESEYGPDYLKAYQESYVSAYKEGNVLGTEHRKDPVVKGKYDAGKYAYVSGYYAGNHHEEYSPDGDDYYQEDWMSDDYFEVYKQAYTDEYIRLYELGYENGKNDPEKEEMITPESLSMYHLATIIKNVTEIMKMHHPQYNLKLIQEMDSYYAPYGLIQGDDQLIDLDDDFKDGLTVKTGGPLEKLVKVQVNGKDLSSANYELRSGSTILTLKEAYLKTLDAGIHTLKLVYIDNVIQAQFVIRKTQKQTPSDNRRYSIPLTGVES